MEAEETRAETRGCVDRFAYFCRPWLEDDTRVASTLGPFQFAVIPGKFLGKQPFLATRLGSLRLSPTERTTTAGGQAEHSTLFVDLVAGGHGGL